MEMFIFGVIGAAIQDRLFGDLIDLIHGAKGWVFSPHVGVRDSRATFER